MNSKRFITSMISLVILLVIAGCNKEYDDVFLDNMLCDANGYAITLDVNKSNKTFNVKVLNPTQYEFVFEDDDNCAYTYKGNNIITILPYGDFLYQVIDDTLMLEYIEECADYLYFC
ncbi:MAG: hypothetical protein IJ789_08870 [Bacteroidales bacterium]|nr:hypothetical protein [Bacteroidales bacterium]